MCGHLLWGVFSVLALSPVLSLWFQLINIHFSHSVLSDATRIDYRKLFLRKWYRGSLDSNSDDRNPIIKNIDTATTHTSTGRPAYFSHEEADISSWGESVEKNEENSHRFLLSFKNMFINVVEFIELWLDCVGLSARALLRLQYFGQEHLRGAEGVRLVFGISNIHSTCILSNNKCDGISIAMSTCRCAAVLAAVQAPIFYELPAHLRRNQEIHARSINIGLSDVLIGAT